MALSVVIPVYNQRRCLDLTLRSLCRQTLDCQHFEIVIVDDGSSEDPESVVEKYQALLPIRLARQPTNRGRAAARNRGARQAVHDRLLFLDADSYAHPELLARHHSFNQSWPEKVLLGSRYEGCWRAVAAPTPAAGDSLGGERDRRLDWGIDDPAIFEKCPAPWFFAYTHNISIPRKQFQACGGFDEAYMRWGHEDVELAYRLFLASGRKRGYFEFDPEAVCFHLPHFREQERNYAQAREMLSYNIAKHESMEIEVCADGPLGMRILPTYLERLSYLHSIAGGGSLTRALEVLPPLKSPGRLGIAIAAREGVLQGKLSLAFEHRPLDSHTAPSLVGVRLPFTNFHFAEVLNLDIWRILSPEHLSKLVIESLRVARVAYLGFSKSLPGASQAGLADDPWYVSEMLGQYCDAAIFHDTGELCLIRAERK